MSHLKQWPADIKTSLLRCWNEFFIDELWRERMMKNQFSFVYYRQLWKNLNIYWQRHEVQQDLVNFYSRFLFYFKEKSDFCFLFDFKNQLTGRKTLKLFNWSNQSCVCLCSCYHFFHLRWIFASRAWRYWSIRKIQTHRRCCIKSPTWFLSSL